MLKKKKKRLLILVQALLPTATLKKNFYKQPSPLAISSYPQETVCLFPRKNINNEALVVVRRALFLLMMLDAALKTRSEGAEVAGIQKNLFASLHK